MWTKQMSVHLLVLLDLSVAFDKSNKVSFWVTWPVSEALFYNGFSLVSYGHRFQKILLVDAGLAHWALVCAVSYGYILSSMLEKNQGGSVGG